MKIAVVVVVMFLLIVGSTSLEINDEEVEQLENSIDELIESVEELNSQFEKAENDPYQTDVFLEYLEQGNDAWF